MKITKYIIIDVLIFFAIFVLRFTIDNYYLYLAFNIGITLLLTIILIIILDRLIKKIEKKPLVIFIITFLIISFNSALLYIPE